MSTNTMIAEWLVKHTPTKCPNHYSNPPQRIKTGQSRSLVMKRVGTKLPDEHLIRAFRS